MEANKTVLVTVLQPASEDRKSAGATHEQETFCVPLFNPTVEENDRVIWFRIPAFGRLGPESEGSEFRTPFHCAVSFTNDPGPVNATDMGSLGYPRILFRLENVRKVFRDGKEWMLELKKEGYSCHVTSPER